MILSQLYEVSITEKVGAAIAFMNNGGDRVRAVRKVQERQGRPHACEFGIATSMIEDGLMCILDDVHQDLIRPIRNAAQAGTVPR